MVEEDVQLVMRLIVRSLSKIDLLDLVECYASDGDMRVLHCARLEVGLKDKLQTILRNSQCSVPSDKAVNIPLGGEYLTVEVLVRLEGSF